MRIYRMIDLVPVSTESPDTALKQKLGLEKLSNAQVVALAEMIGKRQKERQRFAESWRQAREAVAEESSTANGFLRLRDAYMASGLTELEASRKAAQNDPAGYREYRNASFIDGEIR